MQRRLNPAQPAQHLVVIVRRSQALAILPRPSAPRIASNPSRLYPRRLNRKRPLPVVVDRADDHRPRPRHRHLHPAAQQYSLLIPALQVLHLPRSARIHPICKPPGIHPARVALGPIHSRHPGRIEPSLDGPFPNPLAKLPCPHASHISLYRLFYTIILNHSRCHPEPFTPSS